MDLWEPMKLTRGRCYGWQVGPLRLWIVNEKDEWEVGYEQTPGEQETSVVVGESFDKPLEITWQRLVCRDDSYTVQLLAALADRAVVVSSESPLKIIPGNRALFFISLPLWVRICVGEGKKIILAEVPTVVLSNTWFGDPMTGELCYSVKTTARRTAENDRVSPHTALCPVWIRNSSESPLDFDRLCVHVENLKIYRGLKRLWTNEVFISVYGAEQLSKVEYSLQAPSMEKGSTLMTEPRVPVDRSLVRRSFSLFKYFTNM